MPSGGYGIDPEDRNMIERAFEDGCSGLFLDWCAAYATARSKGATPSEAAWAAYVEWDL